jgi:hypothetical protein
MRAHHGPARFGCDGEFVVVAQAAGEHIWAESEEWRGSVRGAVMRAGFWGTRATLLRGFISSFRRVTTLRGQMQRTVAEGRRGEAFCYLGLVRGACGEAGTHP